MAIITVVTESYRWILKSRSVSITCFCSVFRKWLATKWCVTCQDQQNQPLFAASKSFPLRSNITWAVYFRTYHWIQGIELAGHTVLMMREAVMLCSPGETTCCVRWFPKQACHSLVCLANLFKGKLQNFVKEILKSIFYKDIRWYFYILKNKFWIIHVFL
jgi:hypothetical protein